MSNGSSTNTGPGTPLVAMRNAVRMYSANRRGSDAVNDALVMGRRSEVCSISCSAPLPMKRARPTTEDDQRHLRLERVRDTGHAVGDARPGGDDRHAALSGKPRPAVGRVHRCLLVPRVDDVDSVTKASVVDRRDVTAAECEHAGDTLALELSGHDVSADDDFGHESPPAGP